MRGRAPRYRRSGSTTRSLTARSTGRAADRSLPSAEVDVYLLPAIVGGGLGDIDEVLCAGRYLARAGFPVSLYRSGNRALPPGVDGPWAWPPYRRTSHLDPRAGAALTVAPAWGVSAAPARSEPFGRAGPWATEAAEVEEAYGPERTLHISLEEFARTLTPDEETAERFREGGVPSRTRGVRLARARQGGEVEAYRNAYRRYRSFDRPNVLPLFATFRFDRAFAREFPEAVQTGPLWPGERSARRRRSGKGRWVWYASPASAEAIAPAVVVGLSRASPVPRLLVRTPRPWSLFRTVPGVELRTGAMPAGAWRRTFRDAGVRIVTGSRSLLEALEEGGPFLYFNGVLGRGPGRRRHRPEKIVAFLKLARAAGWDRELLRDLDDFSRGRRVAAVVTRAASAVDGWARFPSAPRSAGFAPGFEDAGGVIVRAARSLAETGSSAGAIVARLRRASNA